MNRVFFLLGLCIAFLSLKAQIEDESKYGNNPEKCKMNLSLYREFYKQGNYHDAYEPWSSVFRECPKASKNTFIHGTKIVWDRIINTKDPNIKQKYIDTLMLVYDKRIEFFNEKGKVLGYKGADFNKLFPEKKTETLKILLESIELEKENSDPAILTLLMSLAADVVKQNKLSAEEVLEYYNKCIDILSYQLQLKPDDEVAKKAQENIDLYLVNSGVATCDKIIPILREKYNKYKDDLAKVKSVVKLLSKQECTDNDLFFQASEQLYKLEPSAFSAYSLAQMFVKKNEYSKAINYYQQAINLDTNNYQKAQYYYEMAIVTGTQLKQFTTARNYALKAAELRKNWGKPYILIGQLYALSAKECGEDNYYQSLVYIAAVDKFVQAKNIDPSCVDEANKLIISYSSMFPKKEDMFFHGHKEGESYTITCWINETIKIKVVD
ncbi:MAG: tetratricopeptide repeat protein [Bacteroidales bacterium]|nr:tetratricopeptide repeat protein [Bacteroidales bacterium]